jgi:hypothetical protein
MIQRPRTAATSHIFPETDPMTTIAAYFDEISRLQSALNDLLGHAEDHFGLTKEEIDEQALAAVVAIREQVESLAGDYR